MDDPHKDLRSLGDRLFDKRDLPIATGTSKTDRTPSISANMIRPKSFYFATDTGIFWYSDGSTWTAASNQFGPRIFFASNETEVHFTSTGYTTISGGPALAGLDNGSYIVWFGASIQATNADTVNAAVMPNSNGPAISAALEVQGIFVTFSGTDSAGDTFSGTASTAGGHVSASRAVGFTLAAGAGLNRLDVVYKTQLGHDCDQRSGWLIALKYA